MSSTDPIIEAMQKPGFYPHDVDAPIRLVQTHISFVLLTGPYAYKVKKPVDFGFVNFSTLELRRHFCEEELRLNRACSPELYLAVVPIREIDGGYALEEGPGGIVEYAVMMRQFRDEDLLLNVFKRGALTIDHISEIAGKMAAFHEQAATSDAIGRYGEPAWSLRIIHDNEAVERRFLGVTQTRERYEAVKTFMETFVHTHEALFHERIKAGKIRECHGDLHLNNICLYDGTIHFFDRIEFNESLKNIDVMYDAAFLVMDLTYRGRKDFANRLLNLYLERTGDYGAARLLPLYLSVRAAVRGKVCSLQSADEHMSSGEQVHLRERADAYYNLAYEYSKPRQGCIYAMCGLPGSGKSTVAWRLAEELDAVVIRSDALRKHLAGVPLDERSETIYTAEWSKRTYGRLTELGIEISAAGIPVILDGTFSLREGRQKLAAEAAARGIPFQIIWCRAADTELRNRLAARRGDVSDATVSVLSILEETFEPPDESESAYTSPLWTDRPDSLNAMLRALTCP